MLRIVQSGNALPISYPVDPAAHFQPGMVAQLGVHGNNIVCGVSDGTAPLGIIDEIKTNAFSANSIDETVIAYVPPQLRQTVSGSVYLIAEISKNLANPNVMQNSFVTNPVQVELNVRNGVITFPEGTMLNFDMDGDGIPDSIRTVVSYTYQVPNIPGDDSTAGSGKITVWFQRMIFQTDMFETNQRYPLNANLFVNECGLLTTRQPSANHPGVAIVTGSPGPIFGSLEALLI